MKYLFFTTFLFISISAFGSAFSSDFVAAAIDRTHHNIRYDGAYFSIDYPNGDVPSDIGVCTDVIIRSYREIGADLQQLVHEDMLTSFNAYPSKRIWGLSRPDKNIDHRRVPNLRAFFERHGEVLEVSNNPSNYQAGDLVTWVLPGNLPHIGIVTNQTAEGSGRPLVVHNIGLGPKLEDMILAYKITGHYRYVPQTYN